MEANFAVLKSEHQVISRQLQAAKGLLSQGQGEQGLLALQKLEALVREHYRHEDDLLFSRLFGKPRLCEGGPFCTLYFDSFMQQRPFQKVEALLRKVDPSFVLPQTSSPEQKYIQEKSPLAIPSEEHLAILILLNELISRVQGSSELSPTWQLEALNQLAIWIGSNHEKEENCLFSLAANVLRQDG